MTTYQQQIFQDGEDKLMSSLEVCNVNLNHHLGEKQSRMKTAATGHVCFRQYAKFSQLGLFAKMLMESHRWLWPGKELKWEERTIYSKRITYIEKKKSSSLKEFGRILSQNDILSNHLLFQIVPLEHLSNKTEFGSLHKAKAQSQQNKTCINSFGKKELGKQLIDHNTDGEMSLPNPMLIADMKGFPSMWTILPFLSKTGEQNR